jgi:hypothetical protein
MAGRDRRRRRTALLISLLFHTALLAPLLLVAPRLRTAQTPTRATMRLGLVPEAGLGIATHLTPPGSPVMSQAARTPPAARQTSRPQLKPLSVKRRAKGTPYGRRKGTPFFTVFERRGA